MKLSRMLAAVGVTAVVLASIATSAGAQPIRGREVTQETATSENFCDVPGLTVQEDITVESRFMHNTRGPDDLGYLLEHLTTTAVFTNVVNGNSTRLVDTSLQKDLHVTDNGDGTLTILVLATGNVVLYGPDGEVIARDPGQIRVERLVDHGGTPNDRSDDVVLTQRTIKESTGRTDDFCEAGVPLLIG
jgi:hypothetical protein